MLHFYFDPFNQADPTYIQVELEYHPEREKRKEEGETFDVVYLQYVQCVCDLHHFLKMASFNIMRVYI